MTLLLVSFLAGMLTILAPCVVSIIPILLARGTTAKRARSAWLVIAGLGVSIIVFTVLLKATTLLIGVPDDVWKVVSGAIIILFGIVTIFPQLWEWVVLKTRVVFKAQNAMGEAAAARGRWGDLLLGASLGPVFSACSPTYALIVATILPVSPLQGLGYLLVFVAGLSLMLALIAIFGRALIRRLGWGINPKGLFRRVLGVILVIVGLMIVTGLDKDLLGYLVENGWYDFQIRFEDALMR
jgi:cytochrome c biogenesis protein CcdA